MRFDNAIAALKDLKRQHPECHSEADLAIQMIIGKRPNIEAKYDALLLKLDRTITQLEDRRNAWQKTVDETTLFHTRKFAKTHVTAINHLLNDIRWMKARNRDLIEAVKGEL